MRATAYILLSASLGVNLLLGLALLRTNPAKTKTTIQYQAPPQSAHRDHSAALSAAPSSRLLWHRLGSNDLAQLVPNLRAAGLPPRKIAYIVLQLLTEKYSSLLDEVDLGNTPLPYWRNSDVISEMSWSSRQKRERREALWSQRRAEEAQLLGDDLWLAEGIPLVDHIRQANGSILSNKKLSALRDLDGEYSAMFSPLASNANDPANREKLKLLEKEFQKDVAQILTPEEILERDLRYGNAASLLQSRCNFFAATEAEYRALFPIYQQIDHAAPYSDWDEVDDKTKAARKEAETHAQVQIEAILGPTRYAEFKQANDKSASKENQLVTRLGLPLSAAAQLVSIKTDVSSRTELLRKDNTIDPAERSARLAALKIEAESRITAALGSPGLDTYREHAGGWLQSMTEPSQKKPSP